MTDMPERIWVVHTETDGSVVRGMWADTVRQYGGEEYVHVNLYREVLLDHQKSSMKYAALIEAQETLTGGGSGKAD